MLKQRIATALFLIALFLGALLYATQVLFLVFVGLIVLAAAWEWSNLASLQSLMARLAFVIGTAVLQLLISCYLVDSGRDSQLIVLGSACTWWLIALLLVKSFPSTAILWGNRWVKVLMGWFVLIPTWLAMSILLNVQDTSATGPGLGGISDIGRWLWLAVVLIVVLMDTGGYVSGRLFGRRKLAPLVSPGKTWAGLIGGLVINAVLLAVLAWQLQGDSQMWLMLALLIAVTACASVLGDLLESMVKRQRGIKDSGAILPGHGGVLDRVDGMTAAFPVFTLIYLLCAENLLQL